jgi:hypothetical protein
MLKLSGKATAKLSYALYFLTFAAQIKDYGCYPDGGFEKAIPQNQNRG